MRRILISVKDEDIAEKIFGLLKHFEKEVEVIEILPEKQIYDDEYIEKHWREIAMGTHSADMNDDERLYKAYARFRDEKYSD